MADRYNFLFDECVTPSLVALCHDHDHPATHVNHLGLNGRSDRALMATIIDGDYVFVTNNGADYKALYLLQALHPGLIVILPSSPSEHQLHLFKAVLDVIEGERDLINRIVEVDADYVVSMRDYPPFHNSL